MSVERLKELSHRPAFAFGARVAERLFGVTLLLTDDRGPLPHQRGAVQPSACDRCRDALFDREGYDRCLSFYRQQRADTATCHQGLRAQTVPVEGTIRLVASGYLPQATVTDPEDTKRAAGAPPHLSPLEEARLKTLLQLIAQELLQGGTSSAKRIGLFVGESPQMLRVYDTIHRLSESDATVLILGESGTGKELAARALHETSSRANGPFVAQNCGALPEPLLESALFGHVRGAFSGADRASDGLFAAAHGGTLLLDEVGEMSANLQVRLLRVLQERTYTPVGSIKARKADVRVLAATHRNLEAMVEAGTFRRDLFYRLHVLRLELPPLRHRAGDMRLLAEAFARGHGLPPIDDAVWPCLERHRWPGNVRELQAEVARWTLSAEGVHRITPDHLSAQIRDAGGFAVDAPSPSTPAPPKEATPAPSPLPVQDLASAIAALESSMIREGLARTDGNRSQLAKELGISRTTLAERIRRYQLES